VGPEGRALERPWILNSVSAAVEGRDGPVGAVDSDGDRSLDCD